MLPQQGTRPRAGPDQRGGTAPGRRFQELGTAESSNSSCSGIYSADDTDSTISILSAAQRYKFQDVKKVQALLASKSKKNFDTLSGLQDLFSRGTFGMVFGSILPRMG